MRGGVRRGVAGCDRMWLGETGCGGVQRGAAGVQECDVVRQEGSAGCGGWLPGAGVHAAGSPGRGGILRGVVGCGRVSRGRTGVLGLHLGTI